MFGLQIQKIDSPAPVSADRSQPLVCLRNVSKAYQTTAGAFLALKNVSADFYPGELVGIIGKSGAGKTTLLNMITAVDHLTSGEVTVGGVNVHTLSENQIAVWRGRTIGVIYQSFQLMPTLSLLNNVLLPIDLCGHYQGRQSRQRALALLEQVGLGEHTYKLPSAISGGQQQRVAIARALANDPPIVVADEPTGRLDSATAEVIFEMFDRLVQQGKLVIMVSHDPTLARRVSRVLRIVDGAIADEH